MRFIVTGDLGGQPGTERRYPIEADDINDAWDKAVADYRLYGSSWRVTAVKLFVVVDNVSGFLEDGEKNVKAPKLTKKNWKKIKAKNRKWNP